MYTEVSLGRKKFTKPINKNENHKYKSRKLQPKH